MTTITKTWTTCNGTISAVPLINWVADELRGEGRSVEVDDSSGFRVVKVEGVPFYLEQQGGLYGNMDGDVFATWALEPID